MEFVECFILFVIYVIKGVMLFVCTQSIKFNGMCGMYQAFCFLSMLLKELFVFTQSIKCIGMFGFYHAYCLFFMLLKELFVVISSI